MMGDQSFQYLTMDDMKVLKDDSVHPVKVSKSYLHFITSAKEVMFLSDFVCLFICLFVCLSVCVLAR